MQKISLIAILFTLILKILNIKLLKFRKHKVIAGSSGGKDEHDDRIEINDRDEIGPIGINGNKIGDNVDKILANISNFLSFLGAPWAP